MSRDDLQPGHGPDRSWSGRQNKGLVAWLLCSPEQPQHEIREIERFERAAHIEALAIGVY